MTSTPSPRIDNAPVDCHTDRRRAKIRAEHRNGVDGVEVSDSGLTLTVTFLGKAPRELGPEHIRIDGGRRITGITATAVRVDPQEDPNLDDRVHVTVDKAGDHSTYRLSIVRPDAHGYPGTQPYSGFDPRYAHADFSFRQACPSELDCRTDADRAVEQHPRPVLNYTARDYAAIRRLLLDRMTLTVPDWSERHVPDLGVTVVELLAHAGDQLSYYQDTVATEAYLDTARRRVSVRRHARLVDYPMHDGCNARTFVTMEAERTVKLDEDDYRLVAVDLSHLLDPLHRPELGTVVSDEDLERLPPGVGFEVFEPVATGSITLQPAHNAIRFWTWGDEECCLPTGATAATLRDEWVRHDDEDTEPESTAGTATPHPRERALQLEPGDVLIIEEVAGPRTGAAADADPTHRQAVRLISVTPGVDELYDQPVVDVSWEPEDALGFSVYLSARGGQDCRLIPDISVARGNAVLVDHGRSLTVCGGYPEEIPVPPAVVVPPSCAPPEFGCPGGGSADPAIEVINSMIAGTGRREPLSAEDVRTLDRLLGPDATARAGIVITLETGQQSQTGQQALRREIVLPDTTGEQHAALRTLLAQVTYPPVRQRFRPVLRYGPVTQRAPLPSPERIAAGQARLLVAIPARVRARLEELWRQVRGGRRLTKEQLGELTVLFGDKLLATLRITERPVQALRELLARRTELLAARTRRLEVLRARALAGGVLDSGIGWELAHSWGNGYTAGLAPDSPTLAGSARSALRTDPRAALPAVTVGLRVEDDTEQDGTEPPLWTPRRDLLDSGPRDRHVVGEVDDSPVGAGQLVLRFGDGRRGAPPPPGSMLAVSYRVGNGTAGNVGAEAINHLALCCAAMSDGVTRVRNPLAAVGGTDPESLDEVRQLAPLGLRRELLRAVTAADYASLAAHVPGVQRAAAEMRWTGRGREVHVAIDPLGQAAPSTALIEAVAHALAQVRRIGHEVVVGSAVLVPLDIELSLCLAPGYQRAHVLGTLKTVLGNGVRSGGGLGFFHPDELSFGEPVRASRLVAVAAAVPGVVTARVTRLRRQFGQDFGELAEGLLRLGPREIAQVDNDPDSPGSGRLTFVVGGGR